MGTEAGNKRLKQATDKLKWALQSESARGINAMVSLLKSEPGIPILPEHFDGDAWLLNCPNGTLDLRTGQLRPHRREDYITKRCPTAYVADAKCPTWERFLPRLFPPKKDDTEEQHKKYRDDLVIFLHRVLGRCLTGDITEQQLVIFWGEGGNGKSTLLKTVLEVIGEDYAMQAGADLLMTSKGDRHPTEVADLFRKRLVVASEPAQGCQLNEALVKQLTGGDRIRARRMRENFWEFDPTHKVILQTNHKPRITGTDGGIWRRLRLVPFTARFWSEGEAGAPDPIPEDQKADKGLVDKLQAEKEGILAWLVRGCMDWQRYGLTAPVVVVAATKEYRDAEDTLAQWLEECCLGSPWDKDYKAKACDLYASYKAWCESGGEKYMTKKSFGQAMERKGYERYQSNGPWYKGVALNPQAQQRA